MNVGQTVDTFIDFYLQHDHQRVTGSSLITGPNDPVLFTTSGMHPLTPHFTGLPHPHGKRLVNLQRCLRTTDLDEVGDDTRLTVFEMLGSWSLGGYGHGQSLRWGYELLTTGFGIPCGHVYVTVFGGDGQVGPDTDSLDIWGELGVPVELLGEDNWWDNGPTGPCGPDSEIFIWTGSVPPQGTPSTDPRWVEVWNHVGMRYHRHSDGTLQPLPQSNVDTGMGLERMLTVLQKQQSVYDCDLFRPWMSTVPGLWDLDRRQLRIVCDHLRSGIVVIGDGVRPSHTGRGYVLRRLIRRVLTILWQDGPSRTLGDLPDLPLQHTIDHFRQPTEPGEVRGLLSNEEERFRTLVRRGRQLVLRQLTRGPLDENGYRYLHDTHGLPRELVDGLLSQSADS